jgi:phosphoglycolate phosphatase-like HAD superfamily hydrolase
MFRLILFDIDGTLVRTGGAGVLAFGSVFKEVFGLENGTSDISFAGRTDTGLIREMMRNHGVDETAANFELFFQAYPKWLTYWLNESAGRVCNGVDAFMGHCTGREARPNVALLTGNISQGAEIKLRHFNIWERFEFGAFGNDHECRNELAAIAWARGRERIGADLRAEEILVVGDTPKDVECARAIGAKVLAVTTGGATRDELSNAQPDWLVDSLAEFRW